MPLALRNSTVQDTSWINVGMFFLWRVTVHYYLKNKIITVIDFWKNVGFFLLYCRNIIHILL